MQTKVIIDRRPKPKPKDQGTVDARDDDDDATLNVIMDKSKKLKKKVSK